MPSTLTNIEQGNILISESLGKRFYPYKGNHSYNISFSKYNDCMDWITNQRGLRLKEEGYKPELGWGLGVGNYHEDWSALIPVIEKISKIEIERHEVFNGCETIIEIDTWYPRTFGMINSQTGQFMFRFNRMPLHQADTLIEAAYRAVVELLESFKKDENEKIIN